MRSKCKQETQGKYGVPIWRVRVTMLKWKSNNAFSVCCWGVCPSQQHQCTFLPYFNQISIFWTDFHGSPQYQIPRKSVRKDGGHGETNKLLSCYENGSKNVHLSHSRQLRHTVAVEAQPQFLNLSDSCRSVVSATLLPGNNQPYPLNRRLCGPQSRSRRIGE
jgi:hypothetical protein